MTRKRYVKLLMAHGVSRNVANLCAQEVVEEGVSYQEDYDAQAKTLGLINSSKEMREIMLRWSQSITEAMAEVAATVARMSEALVAGFAAFSEAYNEAMNRKREPEA